MTPLSTVWSVASETGVPLWLVLVGLVLALWAAQTWLRRERAGRSGLVARLLPWTLTVILVLTALVVWRPVIIRTTTWQHLAKIVAITDSSASMQLPLRPQDTSPRLDLATAWDAAAVAGRNLAARSLHDHVAATRVRSTALATSLDRLAGEVAQGIPLGSEATLRLEEYAALQKTVRVEIANAIPALQPLIQGSGAVGSGAQQQALGDALALLEQALAGLPEVSASGTERLGSLLVPLAAFNRAGEICLPLLDQLQENADRNFVEAGKDRLAPILAAATRRTRADLAACAARSLPAGTRSVTASGDPAQSDLYAQVAEATRTAAGSNGEVLSHVVLFSDGTHNGGADPGVAARLKKEGITLVTVETGLPGQAAADVAILEWNLPRVLSAGRPARLRASVAAVPGAAFTITLALGDRILATVEGVGAAQGLTPISVEFTAPAEGRHVLRLGVTSPVDTNPGNNTLQIQADCSEREARLLLVGSIPDWDTAWFSLAAGRQGCALTQVFAADEPPKRGSLSRAIPASLPQWSRFRAVLLHGPAFTGFSEQDATDLQRFVVEKGGTLLIFAEPAGGFTVPLAARFGWNQEPRRVESALHLVPSSAQLPCLRLGVDGPQSARRFAELGRPAAAFQVPPQDLVLIEGEAGEAVCSIGFYGRGKVIQWGLRGLHRQREFDHAAVVDRLLDAVCGELAAPLFAAGAETPVALYPALPQAGRSCLAILPSTPEKPAPAKLTVDGQELAAARTGLGNAQFAWVPQGTTTAVTVAGAALSVPVSANPGMEALFADANPAFLRDFSEVAGGTSVSALKAAPVLTALSPPSYTTQTGTSWRLGSSTYLLAGLILALGLHWVLRKLAGLAI